MKVTVTKKGSSNEISTYFLQPGATVMDLMEKADMFVDVTISIKNGRIIPCDETLSDGDEVTLLEISSGG